MPTESLREGIPNTAYSISKQEIEAFGERIQGLTQNIRELFYGKMPAEGKAPTDHERMAGAAGYLSRARAMKEFGQIMKEQAPFLYSEFEDLFAKLDDAYKIAKRRRASFARAKSLPLPDDDD